MIIQLFFVLFDRETIQNEQLQANQEPPSNFFYHDEYKIIRELLLILISHDKRVSKRVELLRTQTSVPSLIQVIRDSFI